VRKKEKYRWFLFPPKSNKFLKGSCLILSHSTDPAAIPRAQNRKSQFSFFPVIHQISPRIFSHPISKEFISFSITLSPEQYHLEFPLQGTFLVSLCSENKTKQPAGIGNGITIKGNFECPGGEVEVENKIFEITNVIEMSYDVTNLEKRKSGDILFFPANENEHCGIIARLEFSENNFKFLKSERVKDPKTGKKFENIHFGVWVKKSDVRLLRCSVCGRRDKTFLHCATCGEELYCDDKCRKRDEKIHRFSCGKWYTTVGLHGAETIRIEIKKKTSKNKHAIKKNSEIKNDIEGESGSGNNKN